MTIKIKKQLAPTNAINQRTHGYGNPCSYITIHQTGNTSVGANAQAHANIQSKLNPRQASWHYSVDDKEIIQSFEDSVKCWHATDGKGPGNTTSIAIEICINSDGDYVKAVKNAAELTKYLMDKHGLSIDKVKQHHDWYPKDCPAQLRAGYKGITWSDFLSMVKGVKPTKPIENKVSGVSTTKPSNKSIDQLADEVIAGKHGSGNARKKALGAQYAAVQKRVNEKLGAKPKPAGKSISTLVEETLAGKHGNGEARKKSLGKNYKAVQDIINGKSSAPKPKTKSISQMATEVIRGDHGDGHETRRKSLGISKAEYEKVRKEVNKRL